MPGRSRHHAIDHDFNGPTVTPDLTRELQPSGNAAAQEQLEQAGSDDGAPGLLHLCMLSTAPDAVSCLQEGATAASTHGWIALEEPGEKRKSWGFWPTKGDISAVVKVPGFVMSPDDKDGESPTASQSFEVDAEQIESLKAWIAANKNWNYSFGVQNCVHWATAATEATGHKPSKMTIPMTDASTLMQCPSGSIQGMRASNKASGWPEAGMLADPSVRGEAEWNHLSAVEQTSWAALGYDESNWETGNPSVDSTAWDELAPEQRKAATKLGYTAASWNAQD